LPGGTGDDAGMSPVRCSATSKRTGQRCGAYVRDGATVCRHHGGRAPQALAAADRRLVAARARADLERLGVSIETTPVEALEAMLWEAAGNVAVLRALVSELAAHPVIEVDPERVEEGAEAQPHGGWLRRRTADGGTVVLVDGIYGPDHNGDGKPHVLVTLYGEERDRLARLAKDCAGLGLDERRVRVAEATTERLFGAVRAAIDAAGLAGAQREAFTRTLAAGLRGLASPAGG
jgi:hypothetical protein